MKIAIVTFDGFNEIDSFLALNILNRVQREGWKAELCGPSGSVESMNGVRVELQRSLAFATDADAVLIGSGRRTLDIIEDPALMSSLRLEPKRQLIGSQCSGALVLWKLGLLDGQPVCTDHATRRHAEAAGLRVLQQPFFCQGNVATAGGCLSAQYLCAWVIARLQDRAAAAEALEYVVPVGEEERYVERALKMADCDENTSSARYTGHPRRAADA